MFSEGFLLQRPLTISGAEPTVLLIGKSTRPTSRSRACYWRVLSDFAVSQLGTLTAAGAVRAADLQRHP